MQEQNIYVTIDLKSFYASVECRERGQVFSDQAEQVNTKRNNTNNLTAYGQKMINDSNIIKMIPKNKDIRAV